MTTEIKEIVMNSVICCKCGILFGLETSYQSELQRNGKTFYCPNGHSQWYGEGEADKLKKKLKEKDKDIQYWYGVAETERHAKNGMKGQFQKTKNELTRTKQRISNGGCPCCKRQFVNLKRHMNSKHPDYKDE